MPRESCIQHTSKVRSVVIKSDYLAICANDHCAAALLGLIEFWANGAIASEANPPKKIKLGEFTSKELYWWLLGFYSTKRIMERVTMLKNRGWISYKESANHKSRTYWANISAIQSALDKRHLSGDICLPQTNVSRQMSEQTLDKCLDKPALVQTNVSTSLYSNFLSNFSLSKESEGGQNLNPEESRSQNTPSPFAGNPDPESPPSSAAPPLAHENDSRSSGIAACDNSAFVGNGNIAPDGKRRAFNQISGKWASASFDPWMNNQNPLPEFKEWVYRKAIASGRQSSLANAAGEIRNNYQRAMDLWEEYQVEQEQRRLTAQSRQQVVYAPAQPPQPQVPLIETSPEARQLYEETMEKLRRVSAEQKAKRRF